MKLLIHPRTMLVSLGISVWTRPLVAADSSSSASNSQVQDVVLAVTGDLTLEQAITFVLNGNPSLEARAALLRAEEANVRRAGFRENPTLEFSAENFAGTGNNRAIDNFEGTISVSQRVELGNDRELRRQRAEIQRDLESIGGEIARQDLIASVKEAFLDTLAAQAMIDVEREGLTISERLQSVAAKQARAGGGAPADINYAAIDLAKVRLRLAGAEDALQAARLKLAAFWGDAAPRFTKAVGSLAIPEQLPEPDESYIDQSLAALQSRAEHQLGLATIADAEAQAQPDLTLSGGLRYFRDGGRMAAVVGASIPVPVSDTSGVEEARHRASQAQARVQASKRQLISDLALVRSHIQAALRELRVLDETLLPKSIEGLKILEKAYAQGGSTYVELAAANRSLIDLKLRRVSLICEAQRQRYRFERLLGKNDPRL